MTTMEKMPITPEEAEWEQTAAIISYEIRTPTKWITYHCLPYETFIIEVGIQGPGVMPEFEFFRAKCQDTAEWTQYFEKLLKLRHTNPHIRAQVHAGNRIVSRKLT
jgi:hypothetical protein